MAKKLLIDAKQPEETRVVLLNGNRIEDFDQETTTKLQNKGNIYLARVTRVEPSLQAAFIEYGGNRHGFLAFSEIHPDYYRIPIEDRKALTEEMLKAEKQNSEEKDKIDTGHQKQDAIIRSEEKPKPVLIKKFNISEIQAEAILELKLRHLAKLEEIKIKTEADELDKERKSIELLLSSEARLKTFIKKELRVILEEFGDKRRCQIVSDVVSAQAFNDEDMIPAENVTVVLSEKGWVKAAKGHDIDSSALNYKSGDAFLKDAKGRSNKMAIFLDSTGRSYTLIANSLPSARGQGEPLTGRLTPPIGAEFIDVVMGEDDQPIILSSDAGYGFISSLGNLQSKTKSGKHAITLSKQAKTMRVTKVDDLDEDFLAVVTNRARLLIFPVSELPQLSKGKGNKLIQIKSDDFIDREEFLIGLCTIKSHQKLRVEYGNGKKHKTYSFEDLVNFTSHRARKGLTIPGVHGKALGIDAID